MKFIRPHRLWLGLLGFAALLYFGVGPLIENERANQAKEAKQIEAVHVQVKLALRQLEEDIAAAQKLGKEMSAEEVDRLLAPVNRLKTASMLEQQAAAAHVQNFSYTLAPEQKITVPTPGGGSQQLAQSDITLAGDMPLDTDAYSFIENIRHQLPGRAQLRALTLEHAAGDGKPLAAVNMHMSAQIEWLSSGTDRTMLGGL